MKGGCATLHADASEILQSTKLGALIQTWPTQFAIAAFFTMGFAITYYQLWRHAFVTESTRAHHYLARTELVVLGLVLGILLNLMGIVVPLNSNSMMFHNLGIFVFFFMMLDERINLGEFILRCLAIYGVLLVQHGGNYDRWQFWVSLAAVTLVVVGAYIFDQQIRATTRANVLFALVFALSFWPWLPSLSAGLNVNPTVQLEAVLMFWFMAWVAKRYWERQGDLADTNANMTEQANYDALTQARSYSLYEREAVDMITTARADGTPLTAVMFDIDHFKAFNDRFGHPAGDAVLIGVFATVRKTVLQYVDTDYIYRVGGEEFMMLFPDMTVTQVTRIVRDCYQTIQAATFTYEATELHVTISMGVTGLRPDDRDLPELYKRVDEFLYQSKNSGRNAITIEGRTEKADGDKADVGYRFFAQPIVDVDDDGATVVAKELLLRMRSADGSRWVLPNTFDIDVEVQIRLLKKVMATTHCCHLGINLLPSQFTDFRVARTLAKFVASQPDFTLTVEITGVPDTHSISVVASIYHDAGIRLLMDNVGSRNHFEAVQPMLEYLDALKFSLQNLRREHDTENLDARLQFWSQVAREHDLQLVISGVESKRDATHARTRFGAERQQGYLYGRPSIPND